MRLTNERVAEIRRLYGSGVSSGELARAFGVTRRSVLDAVAWRTWRDAPSVYVPPDAVTVTCPVCKGAMAVLKPGIEGMGGKRKAGAWCGVCKKAWRLLYSQEEWCVFRRVWVGGSEYVLNGKVVGDACD